MPAIDTPDRPDKADAGTALPEKHQAKTPTMPTVDGVDLAVIDDVITTATAARAALARTWKTEDDYLDAARATFAYTDAVKRAEPVVSWVKSHAFNVLHEEHGYTIASLQRAFDLSRARVYQYLRGLSGGRWDRARNPRDSEGQI